MWGFFHRHSVHCRSQLLHFFLFTVAVNGLWFIEIVQVIFVDSREINARASLLLGLSTLLLEILEEIKESTLFVDSEAWNLVHRIRQLPHDFFLFGLSCRKRLLVDSKRQDGFGHAVAKHIHVPCGKLQSRNGAGFGKGVAIFRHDETKLVG